MQKKLITERGSISISDNHRPKGWRKNYIQDPLIEEASVSINSKATNRSINLTSFLVHGHRYQHPLKSSVELSNQKHLTV